jgi:hypothetical protein
MVDHARRDLETFGPQDADQFGRRYALDDNYGRKIARLGAALYGPGNIPGHGER